jgi:hypothetical protein
MAAIPLTGGFVALVDDVDLPMLLAMGAWQAQHNGATTYARKSVWIDGRATSVNMHSVILGVSLVDHVNGDGLDNRRANLRAATSAQNAQNRRRRSDNTSGYKGVSWHRSSERWSAYITADGRRHHLGRFDDPTDAARAYDTAARELHGAFAALNFPEVTA